MRRMIVDTSPLKSQVTQSGSSIVLGLVLMCFASLPVGAQDCEVPLYVQQYAMDANVMFLVDNSSSMNEAVLHQQYDRDITYDGPFESDELYFIPRTRLYDLTDFDPGWGGYGDMEAPLVQSDNGEDGRYWGNYLNWIYFHATDEQRDSLPQLTRIQVTKLALCDIVQRSQRIRFGVTVFHLEGPGNIIGNCGTNPTALTAVINGITANKWTPIAESMETIVDYFKIDRNNGPIQAACQMNFLVIMTDGFPTKDTEVSAYLVDADGDGNDPGSCTSIGAPFPDDYDCSDSMDDVAYYLYNTDLRPDLGEPGETGPEGQNVITYTIGFAVDYGLLADTAFNGNGQYYYAEDAAELVYAFQMVMQDIIMRISSGSAVAVVSTESGDDDRMYRGKFMPGTWEGFLEAYAIPYEDGDDPVWEAGNLLASRSAGSRDIFTALGLQIINFTASNAATLVGAMNVPDPVMAEEIIRWTTGETVPGYRNRGDWKLGDIISSTPVVVGPPSSFIPEEAYQTFMFAHADRTPMIYVCANDGMLHAFRAEDGEESWAFVPEFALPKLSAIADSFYCHTFSCDQTASVKDMKVGGIWRTVLAAGGGQGGSSYFALDVTAPYDPQLLWQVDLPNGVPRSSEVELATIGGTSIALIGSGLDENNGEAYLHAYNIQTGQLLGSVLLSVVNRDRNKATRPQTVDVNMDGDTDLVYIADLSGKVWRFEVGSNPSPHSWAMSCLFSGDRPISATPTLAYGEGGLMVVYFGTGAYMTGDDIETTDDESFYCVFDDHDGITSNRFDLVDQTSHPTDIGAADGWYVDLVNAQGERVTEKALVVARTVYFTSFAPVSDICQAGGSSWFYTMAYDDGMPVENEEGEEVARSHELGDGVASRPVVDIVNERVIVQSSDATINVEEITATFFYLNVRSWQESYSFVEEPPAEP